MTDVTVTNDPPAPNTPEARTPDGQIKDVSTPNTTPSTPPTNQSSSTEGGSTFLTQKPTEPAKPDAKPEGETKPETKPDAPVGAPDKYTDFTLPEGYTFDPTALTDFQALAKANNLSQDAAQGLVDLWSKHAAASAKAPYDLWADTQQQWHKEILSRFGGEDGAKKMSADVNKVFDSVLPPSLQKSFRAALDFTGAGSNPDFLEGLSIMLKPLMEGKPVVGGNPSKEGQQAPTERSGPIDLAAAMYPNLVGNRPK